MDARAGVATIHRAWQEEVEIVRDAHRDDFHIGYVTAQNLVDVILGQAQNGSPAEVGWRAVELLDAAYRSADEEGHPITVKELYR